jgi:hypothetical protein
MAAANGQIDGPQPSTRRSMASSRTENSIVSASTGGAAPAHANAVYYMYPTLYPKGDNSGFRPIVASREPTPHFLSNNEYAARRLFSEKAKGTVNLLRPAGYNLSHSDPLTLAQWQSYDPEDCMRTIQEHALRDAQRLKQQSTTEWNHERRTPRGKLQTFHVGEWPASHKEDRDNGTLRSSYQVEHSLTHSKYVCTAWHGVELASPLRLRMMRLFSSGTNHRRTPLLRQSEVLRALF